jgi:hypothetical protein
LLKMAEHLANPWVSSVDLPGCCPAVRLRVRGDCQKTALRSRALVKPIWERFSRPLSRTRSMAAPRRTQDRRPARSTMSGLRATHPPRPDSSTGRWCAAMYPRCGTPSRRPAAATADTAVWSPGPGCGRSAAPRSPAFDPIRLDRLAAQLTPPRRASRPVADTPAPVLPAPADHRALTVYAAPTLVTCTGTPQ